MNSKARVSNSLARDGLLAVGGSLLIAIGAQISIPFVPVPFSLQTFALMLLTCVCDKRIAVAAVMIYLLEGSAGFPVFANCSAGAHVLFGPTGGYLLGFVPAVYFGCSIVERYANALGILCGSFLVSFVVLLFGAIQLSSFIGVTEALYVGVFPFLFSDIVKSVVCAGIFKQIRR